MAGMNREVPIPSDIKLHKVSKTLELVYDDNDERYTLPCEYLRVFTPSAEARGHGPGQEKLQHGCIDVTIERIDPVGTYALRLVFSDGHDTGLYSWDLLYELATHYDTLWADYLERLQLAGLSREKGPASEPIELNSWRKNTGACQHHHHD